MKFNRLIIIGTLTLTLGLASCDSYINQMPKGNLVPSTLEDYEAFLRSEYSVNYLPCLQTLYLINDKFVGQNQCRNVDDLRTANYMWKEDRDRKQLNSSTEDMFDNGYRIIGICNTIIESVPETTTGTPEQKNEVMAYAYAIRAFVLHQIVNYYADAYDPERAASTPGIPLIYSGGLGSPYHQGSVKEVYDQIVSDFNKAIELGVPETSMTIIHPSRAAVEAGLARVYLSMREYEKALNHAEESLKRKSDLFDWNEYYSDYEDRIANPDDYTKITSPLHHTNVENIWFCSGNGNPNRPTSFLDISEDRAARFEAGDSKFLVSWKKMQSATDTYYAGMLSGYYNQAGIATPEVYLIKAECLARKGEIGKAMKELNTVREKRILPDVYQDATAADEAEAIEKIRLTKDNELIGSIFPFIDLKRYNAEGKYPRDLKKVFDGKEYTLSAKSHMWTMVFPANAINRPGNGTLTQNVDK